MTEKLGQEWRGGVCVSGCVWGGGRWEVGVGSGGGGGREEGGEGERGREGGECGVCVLCGVCVVWFVVCG